MTGTKAFQVQPMIPDRPTLRAQLRLGSGLILFAFVTMHLTAHVALLISTEAAMSAMDVLMAVWWTMPGLVILGAAALTHYLNALWSIYARRSLRMSGEEAWQLGLGLCIPLLLTLHVVGTRVAGSAFGAEPDYHTMLLSEWVAAPWLVAVQSAAVIVVWAHGCIGLRSWLSNKAWYRDSEAYLGALAVLLPALALAGFVTAGNQMRREVKADATLPARILAEARITDATKAAVSEIAATTLVIHVVLVLLPFGARAGRRWLHGRRKPPMLTHANGRTMPILNGASVLETLRDHGIPHAAACGGRARCTTCRVLVTEGADRLSAPDALEAKALARAEAGPDVRLACQIRPTANLSILPLLAAEATAREARAQRGFEGRERPITVVFADLRGSTRLSEAMMPYDVLFLLNQFFREMTRALTVTNGHYSQFTGDGLMALYGLNDKDPAQGAADAIRGAAEMLRRLDMLNQRRGNDRLPPLRIGIGIHFSQAIVGAMGPPRAQTVTAVGDTVNICARLESLTKDHRCAVIVSRRAAEAARLDVRGHTLHRAPVKGRVAEVEFYAFTVLPDFLPA